METKARGGPSARPARSLHSSRLSGETIDVKASVHPSSQYRAYTIRFAPLRSCGVPSERNVTSAGQYVFNQTVSERRETRSMEGENITSTRSFQIGLSQAAMGP